ncbi:flagellar hook-length control protein FliK [Lachnospiraceae bacterium PF1-21]|uniref:Flagellar hook-length control protein FliK n=1 Tax=Ohessyouella blattaphilus TaxID=2949333 RepID=A0ABT1EEL1_9FIRM|nr:flagellar hook-length control protein FliK [Ohessyouella blattaphilus]MCP1109120.1 flagellar hook-length control protein FliK [Ohessyouella blattaphilus]MCR8562514.1 flagellar hook-length control protein FliK [Ohessyouella blattaphilus]
MNQVIPGLADGLLFQKGSITKKTIATNPVVEFGELLNLQSEAEVESEEVVVPDIAGCIGIPIPQLKQPEMKTFAGERVFANQVVPEQVAELSGKAVEQNPKTTIASEQESILSVEKPEARPEERPEARQVSRPEVFANQDEPKERLVDGVELGAHQEMFTVKTGEQPVLQESSYTKSKPVVTLQELPEVTAQKLKQEIRDFEIKLKPAHLGEVTIKATYDEQGRTIVSVFCEEASTLKVLTQEAPNLAGLIQERLGTPCQVVTESQAPDYLEQEQQQNQKGQQEKNKNEKQQETREDDFLQQLRLGLL